MAAGVFNTNLSSALGGKGGLNFAFQQGNRGALSVVQVNYLFNDAPGDTGLPGQYSSGGFYNSNKFSSLSNPSTTKSGTYSVYGMFQQMVYRDGGAGDQKDLTVGGDHPRTQVECRRHALLRGWSLELSGPIAGRDNDIAAVGVIYGALGVHPTRNRRRDGVGIIYQITFNRWLSITPDVQYVNQTSGAAQSGNAFVLGTQLAIDC